MREQRHMAEEIVKDIRFRQIVQFAFLAYPPGHREAAVGEMGEKLIVRDQAGDRNDLKSREASQHLIDLAEIRNAARNVEALETGDEFFHRVARHQGDLTTIKPSPAVMIGGAILAGRLIDGVVGAHARIVAPERVRRPGRAPFLWAGAVYPVGLHPYLFGE